MHNSFDFTFSEYLLFFVIYFKKVVYYVNDFSRYLVLVIFQKVYFKYKHLSPKSTFITYISWTNSSHFRNLKSDGNFELLNSETHLNEDPPQDPAPAQNATGAQNVTDALKSIGAQKE